jgi:hypothetical protein
MRMLLLLVVLSAAASAAEQIDKQFDPAVAFGSRPSLRIEFLESRPNRGNISLIEQRHMV